MKIINLGPYPPPFGGVSIYLKRLKEALDKEGLDNELIDTTKSNCREKERKGIKTAPWKKHLLYCLFRKKAIIHINFFIESTALYYLFFLLKKKHLMIMSFHNERFLMDINKKPFTTQKMIIKFYNSLDRIIVDNDKSYDLARQIIADKAKIFVIPEFIPPSEETEWDNNSVLNEIRSQHKFLLASNATQLVFHNEEDLYGIDLLIDLVEKLYIHDIDVVLCLLLPISAIKNNNYFIQLKDKIERANLVKRFLLITEPLKETASLWKKSDLFIRATNTDGNSVSVLESLFMGTPVLASDCVPRPEGVVLFKSRDFDDLYEQTRNILTDIESFKNSAKLVEIENNAYKLIDLYRSLGG